MKVKARKVLEEEPTGECDVIATGYMLCGVYARGKGYTEGKDQRTRLKRQTAFSRSKLTGKKLQKLDVKQRMFMDGIWSHWHFASVYSHV